MKHLAQCLAAPAQHLARQSLRLMGAVLAAIAATAAAQGVQPTQSAPTPAPSAPSNALPQLGVTPKVPDAAMWQRPPGMPSAMPQAAPVADAATAMPPIRKLPPLETTAFQRFVADTSGVKAPIFGANLFDETSPAFTPMAGVPVPANYVIGPGDEVLVRSTGVLDFELRLTVDRNGQVVLPKVGPVQLAGVRVAELEPYLTREVSRSFRNFTLSATLGQLRSIDIYVVGQARAPGKFTVSSLTSLVNAIFLSGGPNANGSMRRIQLVRDSKVVADFDLYRFILHGDRSRDERLLPGDVIVYSSVGPRVALLGATKVPAIYELTDTDGTIADLLSWSGGVPVLAAPQRVLLERIEPAQSVPRRVEEFSLDAAGLQRRLRDGDVITLLAISPEFANAVTLRGNVAQPLRYPHRPGMRIRDLIPEPEALITRDYFRRKNILVQPAVVDAEVFAENMRSRNALMQSPGRDTDVSAESMRSRNALTQPTGRDTEVSAESLRNDVRNLLDEVNWDYAVIERLDRRDLTTRLIPFNLGRAVLHGDPAHDLELMPGDVVTILGKRDLAVPQQRQTRLVRIEGEVSAPGIYEALPGETLPSLLTRIGGATREAYLYGTEFTRAGVRRQQQQNLEQLVRRLEEEVGAALATRQANLTTANAQDAASEQQRLQLEERLARERLQRLRNLQPTGRVALALDPAAPALPDIPLEDGDRIVVPARPSFVQVVGSVYNDNAFIWREGQRVRDYLKSAGLTEGADEDAVFVLRADGSITADRQRRGWLFGGGNGVLDLALQPGDTIVVPEKVNRETRYTAFMRGLKDWTQIIYQLGLGAAAIKVLQ
ncbi:polysaccharide biosynthesis/export family protein [Azohydromonas sediminis]|uniref:polysaccharide biosynthesis/export family protein n=1 Tax=Azohydromonas sediminis TaxID=2259674 RepID=UPI0013C35B26|nr:SLBB domain-containing protein [Azohydromonas sediminis]